MRNRVLIVGYSPEILGGVTTVTSVLTQNIPYLDLHAAQRWYGPRWKVAAHSICSMAIFTYRLVFAAPRLVQVIVASRGDALRTLPYLLLAMIRGCKVCLHFHKNRAAILGELSPAARRLTLAAWRRADGYCFLSSRLRAEYDGQFDSKKPCVVIPNPISAEWLRQDIVPRCERRRDLIFLGRWSAEKGIDELLSVMRAFGPGAAARCEIYSDHCPPSNPENCVCHPWLSESGVRQVLREARLVLLPSRAEAFPTVLLEAAACGTPFVASNVAGIPDIAEQSGGGLLHEVGDAAGMLKQIERFAADDALWDACSRNGRRWVESLEASRIVPRWRRFYADLGLKTEEPRAELCATRR